MSAETETAVDDFLNAISHLKSLATEQYTPETCPLNNPVRPARSLGPQYSSFHSLASQALWGLGFWQWDCKFCGEHFEE